MAVNQFTRGIKPQQYKPTYIQKPVKMYQQVAGGLSNRYRKAQQTEDRRQMLIQKLGQSPFEKDQILANKLGEHYSQRRDEREKAGDYENMFRETRRDAQEAMRKVDPIRQNRNRYQQWAKAIDKRDDISEKKKREWKQMVVDNYNRTQGGLDFDEGTLEATGGYFEGSQPSADVNIPKKAEELAESWKAEGRETVQILDSNETYQTVDIEGASDEQIKAYATQALRGDPEVQAYLEDESELRTYHSGPDLSRYLQPQEVFKRDKKGNIIKDDEGRPLMKEVSTAEALIGESAPQRVEKYVDQGLSEENARKEAYKDLYKQEQMAKGAGFAAEKYGYLDIDRDLGSLSGYGDSGGGRSGDEGTGGGLVFSNAVPNPNFDKNWFEDTPQGNKEFVPEKSNSWQKFWNNYRQSVTGKGEEEEATWTDWAKGIMTSGGLKDVGKSLSDAMFGEGNQEFSDNQKEMISRATVLAEKSFQDDVESGEIDIQEVNPADVIEKRTKQLLNNMSSVNSTEVQPTDPDELEDVQDVILNYKQYQNRNAHYFDRSGNAETGIDFGTAFNRAMDKAGVGDKSISKALKDGDIAISGKVAPDNPYTSYGYAVKVGRGNNASTVIVDGSEGQKARNRRQWEINQSKYKLESRDVKIPENITDEQLNSLSDRLGMEVKKGETYEFHPQPKFTGENIFTGQFEFKANKK